MTKFDRLLEAAKKSESNRISVSQLKDYTWILAIDPNCSESDDAKNVSGVCLLHTTDRQIWVNRYTFPQLISYFQRAIAEFGHDILVIIEAGWLNKSNWHISTHDTVRSAAKKGRDVGLNHQTGRLLHEMALSMGLDVELQRPLQKHWSGANGKASVADLKAFIPNLPTGTIEDERDAVLLAWHRAGFPLHADPKDEYARWKEARYGKN